MNIWDNQEIKFRAWDGDSGLGMIQWDQGITIDHISWAGYNCGGSLDTLMQYTGFHDREGQEIYIKDYVKHSLYSVPVIIKNLYHFYQILQDIARYGWAAESLEVVGNIYQNPDLLPTSASHPISTTGNHE